MTSVMRVLRRSIESAAVAAIVAGLAFGAGPALAVQPDAKTVPWVAANPLIPHDTVSGASHTLKGTADVQGANFTWTWDFGDGSPVATGTLTAANSQYMIQAAHSYVGSPGDVFSATLTVLDTNTGESDTASYFVAIRADSLETRVNMAIDQGLWRLHTTMNRGTSLPPGAQPAGHWESGCSFNCDSHYVITPSSATAFLVNGHLETGAASNPYTDTVQRAMRWTFTRLSVIAIGLQTYPAPIGTVDPDTNGNGIGIQGGQNLFPYQGGLFVDAIAATGTPAAVATTGPVNVIGRSYLDIVQDMVDAYAWGQGDTNSGVNFGGWVYGWNSNYSDNSANQWAAIALLGAQNFGATVPQFVKDANINSVNVTQTTSGASAGQFGYASTTPVWGPYAVTPSGMVQMVLDGIGRGDKRWDDSENYMRDRFCNTGGAGAAVRDYYYGLFSLTKSMLLHDANGDGIPEPITDLSNQPGGTNPLNWYAAEASAGDACDGVARTLVSDQNPAGYWTAHNFSGAQYPFETAWAIIMLNRTVFASGVPVAVATANPNPAVAFQTITLDGAGSFSQDPALTIDSWEWDLDDDGTYDASGVTATTSFPAVGDYPVTLRVTDNKNPEQSDTTTLIVRVAFPPLAPTANAGGPYNFCPLAQPWFVDGTGSTNPDEGQSEPGQPGDTIQSYEWDLDNNGTFDVSAATPDVTVFYNALGVGDYLLRLRVTDTTATSYPSSGQPDLSDTDSTSVSVKAVNDPACQCIDDLAARPKTGKIQLTWSDTGAVSYNVYRSTTMGGPYSLIANTTSTYSTYLDTAVVNGTTYHYVVREAALNGNELCQSNEASATPPALRPRR